LFFQNLIPKVIKLTQFTTGTKFGNSGKIDAQKKFIEKRAYVVIIED
jgi:putative transposon-encoded protein